MKTSKVLEKLIEFIYNEYCESDAFKEFGEMAGSIEYIERKRKKGQGEFKFIRKVAEIMSKGLKGLLGK